MKIEIRPEILFLAHQELNQITGMIMAVIQNHTSNNPNDNITTMFPVFVKIVEAVNDEMQEYAPL